VEHPLVSVTVIAGTCLEADGWDTPLLVLGPERGFTCAKEHNVAAIFISRVEGGEDTLRATPAWQAQLGR
jgi:thiamine biosynthesis lipoprotein